MEVDGVADGAVVDERHLEDVTDSAVQRWPWGRAVEGPELLPDPDRDLALDLGDLHGHAVEAFGRERGDRGVACREPGAWTGLEVKVPGCARTIAPARGRTCMRHGAHSGFAGCGVATPTDRVDREDHPHLAMPHDGAPALEAAADDPDVQTHGPAARDPARALTGLQRQVVHVWVLVGHNQDQAIAGGHVNGRRHEAHVAGGHADRGHPPGRHDIARGCRDTIAEGGGVERGSTGHGEND